MIALNGFARAEEAARRENLQPPSMVMSDNHLVLCLQLRCSSPSESLPNVLTAFVVKSCGSVAKTHMRGLTAVPFCFGLLGRKSRFLAGALSLYQRAQRRR
jgi:hypothetical protein